jgi:D-aminopeptidase
MSEASKPRARDLGIPFDGQTGPMNAITDVAGVAVGFTTLIDPARQCRTGVTAIRPRQDKDFPQPVWAGFHSLNGNGEMTGTHWINDAGYFQGPVLITNTHAIGAAHEGATRWMQENYAQNFTEGHDWAMPVVAETYDGVLSDINTLHVRPDHAIAALRAATCGPVAEGSVGGGAGMIAYEFKGGTGTSSRIVPIGGQNYTVAALVQANYGRRPWFQIAGVPVGREIRQGAYASREQGSIIAVIATDAPLSDAILKGLARRAGLGIARSGSPSGNSSGDIFLAFSVADPMPVPDKAPALITRHSVNWTLLDPIYLAAVQAVDEAVINAIVANADERFAMVKPQGGEVLGIPTADLLAVMAKYGRAGG